MQQGKQYTISRVKVIKGFTKFPPRLRSSHVPISATVRRSSTCERVALCRPRSRPVRRLWRSRSSVRRVARPDVRRVLCRLPCALCRAGCRQPCAASVQCRRTTGATVRRNRAPDLAARPSGLSPSKGVNLSARPACAGCRPDLRRRRNRPACAVHVRGLFAACGVRARLSGTLPVPTCAASCAACGASCAVPDVRATSSGATVRPITRRVRSSPVKGVNLSARPACADNFTRANVRPVPPINRRERLPRPACSEFWKLALLQTGVAMYLRP